MGFAIPRTTSIDGLELRARINEYASANDIYKSFVNSLLMRDDIPEAVREDAGKAVREAAEAMRGW